MKISKRILTLALTISLFCIVKSQEYNNIALQIFDKDSIPKFLIFKETDKRFLKGQEKEVFKEYLKTTKDDELKLLEEIKKDDLGFTDERYIQLYKGIPVEFSMYFVHIKNDTIETINGQFARIKNLDVSPKISREVALQRAKAYIGAKLYMWEISEAEQSIKNERNDLTATYYPLGKLVIVQDAGNKEMRLAYKLEMYAYEPISRRNVFVDALSGAIIYDEPLIYDYDTPNAYTRYSGQRFINTTFVNGKYRLLDNTRGGGIEVKNLQTRLAPSSAVPFEDLDNNWTALEWNNTQKDNVALDALWGAEKFYDYFKIKFNRNSYDNNGAKLKLYVHYGVNYEGSRWDGENVLLGDGATKRNPMASVDIIGHEFGHAFCGITAYLGTTDEAGAMQEGLGDIWGACVEYYAAPEKSTWLCGEDVVKPGYSPNRSMIDPMSLGDPDKYKGTNWILDPANSEFIHTNCSVMDHWFYHLSMGGEGVSGIGIENAAKVVYRLETAPYITGSQAKFSDARIGALKAAKDAFGFNSNQVLQTGKAWYAVGVGGYDFIPVITNSQITGGGGSNNVPYRRSTTYFITPASDPYTSSYTWSIVPYSMSCSSDKLPYFVSSNSGTQVIINSGSCSGQYIIRCRANNYWCSSYYQDRVITVYNPNGGLASDPDPCAPTINVYPNPTKESEITTLQIQYPCIEEANTMNTDNQYELSIYDVNGNLALKQNFNSDIYSFESQNLKKNNNYILILKDKKGNLYQKHLTID